MAGNKKPPEKTAEPAEDRAESLSSSPCYMEEFPEYFGLAPQTGKPAVPSQSRRQKTVPPQDTSD